MLLLNNSILKINTYLLILIPFLLIFGPALPDIALSLSSILFLAYIVLNKKYYILKNKFVFIFLLFYFYIIFTSLISDKIILSFESSLFYIRYLFFVLCFSYLINYNENILKFLFFSFLLTFIFLIIDSYFQYFFGYNFFGFEYDGLRLSGIFKDEKILGSFLSRMTPLFIGISIFIYGDSKFKIIFILILITLIDILVVLSGERTSIFYMFISTLIITIFISKWKVYRLIAFFISVILSGIIIISNDSVKERVLTKTFDQTNILGEKINTFSIQHQVIYETSFKIFKDHPFFGIGPKNFREKCKQDRYKTFTKLDQSIDGCQSHPHNTYIQLLVETGLFGFFIIFFVFVYLNYLLFKHAYIFIVNKKFFISDLNICMIVAMYVSLWPLAPTGNFFNNWLSVIYFFPLGIFLSKKNI